MNSGAPEGLVVSGLQLQVERSTESYTSLITTHYNRETVLFWYKLPERNW
jgi:hypothetical protein